MQKEIKLDSIRNFIHTELNPNSILIRKQFSSQIALQPEEEQTFIAKISTSGIDRDGDLLIPEGCDISEFENNPVCMWNHTYSQPPIGKVIALQKTKEAIYAKIKLAPTEFATEIWDLVKGGFLSTCSVGFVVQNALVKGTAAFQKYVRDTQIKIDDNCKRIITSFKLIENSLVPIPANSEALILATSKGLIKIDDRLMKEMGIKGGEGSGNFDHAGRPGEVGGSGEGGGGVDSISNENILEHKIESDKDISIEKINTIKNRSGELNKLKIVQESHKNMPTTLELKNSKTISADSNRVGEFSVDWDENNKGSNAKITIATENKELKGNLNLGLGDRGRPNVVDNSIDGTYRHELGHQVQYSHESLLNESKNDFENEWNKAYTSSFKKRGEIMDKISVYAATNHNETFAESFAAYTHPEYGKNNKKLPPEIHNFMTKWIK